MLDAKLLEAYMRSFFGYGNLAADVWFVGMEEGGGSSAREIAQRLLRWQELGGGTVVDNARFHAGVEDASGESYSCFFSGRCKIQPTWAGLIRILLAVQGQTDDSAEAVRRTQATGWGRTDSENCLLELLPLPSPGVNRWHYDAWTDLPVLQSREAYRSCLIGPRVRSLRDLVETQQPRSVVFYSVSTEYMQRWSQVANTDLQTIEPELICHGNQGQPFTARFHSDGQTLFTVIYHPTYPRLTKCYFAGVGQTIRRKLA